MNCPGPPRLGERLLGICLPGGVVGESVLGDLHERYDRLAETGAGRIRRDSWYWSQVMAVGGAYLVRRALRLRRYEAWSRRGLSQDRTALETSDGGAARAEGLVRDAQIAVRQLRKNPVFAIVAIGTLGLGIGVNTALFSAAKETFRPRLPFADAERLVRIYQIPESGSPNISPRAPAFVALSATMDVFEDVAGSRFTDLTLTGPEGPEWVSGNVVSPGWLDALGVAPVLGRGFTNEEEALGSDSRVTLISHAAWEMRFGGSPSALGSVLRLNDVPHSVVGVLPPGFSYPYDVEFWIPFRPDLDQGTAVWAMNIKARLANGVSLAAAQERLTALSRSIEGQVPGFTSGMTLTAVPIRQVLLDDDSNTLLALSLAVGFVLLIASTNLAGVLLSRALARESEFALRSSLGATRGRLMTQTLVESTVLGLLGGTLGLALAHLATDALEPLVPSSLLRLGAEVSIDLPALLFGLVLSLGTGLALGALPAMRLSTTNPTRALKSGSRSMVGGGALPLGRAIVTAELAATLVLLTGVLVMVQVFREAQSIELGYDPSNAVVFSLSLSQEPYQSRAERGQFVRRLVESLEAAPGIVSAGTTTMFPRHQGNVIGELEAEHLPGLESGITVNDRLVSPDYLSTLGARLRSGRWLDERDGAESPPVAVVSQSLARALWPDGEALGGRLRNRRAGVDAPWHEVIGIIDDVRESDELPHSWYRAYHQHAEVQSAGEVTVVVRGGATGSPPSLSEVREAIDRVDPRLPVMDAVTALGINGEAIAQERRGAVIGGAFGLFGVILAALGMYGTVGASVSRRRREFGIRIALGGNRTSILGNLVKEVAGLVVVGGLIGLAGGQLLTQYLARQMESVGGQHNSTLALAFMVLVATALLAGAVPAWRAISVDPSEALAAD